jgi:hypothetical protein
MPASAFLSWALEILAHFFLDTIPEWLAALGRWVKGETEE